MIYRVIQCRVWSIDCLSEGGDLSGGGMGLFDAFALWLVTDTRHKDIVC